jgi:hypothetical protein
MRVAESLDWKGLKSDPEFQKFDLLLSSGTQALSQDGHKVVPPFVTHIGWPRMRPIRFVV